MHVFVCENKRPDGHPRGCCAAKGSAEIREALKKKVAVEGMNNTVRINAAGCLDGCEHGPTMVVYPEAVWYGGVTLADVDEIFTSHILNRVPVERLMVKPD
jgi:(2Fe-2S) ferredoxin